MPLHASVEQFDNECLDLDFVQILEQGLNAVDQKLDHELLVRFELVRLPVVLVDWRLQDGWRLYYLDQLLKEEALQLEATHVAIVCHHCQDITDHQKVKVLVED